MRAREASLTHSLTKQKPGDDYDLIYYIHNNMCAGLRVKLSTLVRYLGIFLCYI